MSTHTLYDQFKRKSVMFCSTTGLAFGPLFDSDDASDFVDEMIADGIDPRSLTPDDLASQIEDWEEQYYGLPDAV